MTNFENTRNVLVAVDVQNDFIDGSLAVTEGDQVVQPLNDAAAAVREAGGDVAFTRDWHPATTPHFADYGGIWPIHCVAETDGAAFHPDLEVTEGDVIINKGMEQTDGYSGWEGVADDGQTLETMIEPRTREEKVRVFIGGLATDYCVKATALDIAERFKDDERVQLYLIHNAIRAVGLAPTDEEKALAAMEEARVQAVSSDDARAMIERTIQ
ncbi:MAG TPA: isochorismatase family protein [Candidatus Saccharibacteria bacterium]|nr:isochorismatase family protein [Candidatus Saccharibacteria bacterium]